MTALSNVGLMNFRTVFLFSFKTFCTPVTETSQSLESPADLIGSRLHPELLVVEG